MITTNEVKYQVKTTDNAPESAKFTLLAAKKTYGFVPNLLGYMANHPALLQNYWDGNENLKKNSTLSGKEQQVAFLAVSFENDCHYCMAAHTSIGQMHKIDEKILNALREGKTIPDKRLEALSKYVKSVTINRGRVPKKDLEDFLDAGFTKENVLEVITIVSLKVMTNYINYIANTEVDTAFQANNWVKPD
ncbi:uncharacterized peroxidase-related enzyme [Tenacibaculum sp. MAR_2009_124]|uniref:carboxymuconolactone decarboxylase family protein n=1 Tax=Tenacibaculum sp. MAR_2009_124 TaxID=1250059 RepID=UPI00089D3911|nr:carboxymuconolactone decarboxylase family protein [Tenacibaculum sp. MAR_2009_124]SEB47188.1 uncharacterized peroxidase-related enzyme [Tenacibaculum sp. MAR_2009_124]